jgi:response regulator of citrate/malate metabolism
MNHALKAPRVLIVEDDPINAMVVEDFVFRAAPSCRVQWVKSEELAEKMIERAEAEQAGFGLVITDYYLSGERTGTDLVNRYHDRVPFFILMSAAGRNRRKAPKVLEGEHYFVFEKPLHEKDFAAKLPKIFEQIGKQ